MTESQTPMNQSMDRSRNWIMGAIIMTCLLWALAVVVPVWDTRSENTGEWVVFRGYFPALLGWLGILAKCPAWFANFLLIWLCVMLFKNQKAGYLLSLVALALAGSAYVLPGIYGDNDQGIIKQRLIGFYLWLGSFVTIALAHAFLGSATPRKWLVVRVAAVLSMLLVFAQLERVCAVGVSPLEATLRDPNDLSDFSATLARNPPQADKDAALYWAIRQELSVAHPVPSKRIAMLILAGANPNQRDKYGETLLMQAVRSVGFVEILVKAGADVNARTRRGKTVLDIAREAGRYPECQKILVDAGARSSKREK